MSRKLSFPDIYCRRWCACTFIRVSINRTHLFAITRPPIGIVLLSSLILLAKWETIIFWMVSWSISNFALIHRFDIFSPWSLLSLRSSSFVLLVQPLRRGNSNARSSGLRSNLVCFAINRVIVFSFYCLSISSTRACVFCATSASDSGHHVAS